MSQCLDFKISELLKYLFVQDDFTTSAHILASLGSSFVGASLKTNDSLTSLNNVVRKFALVLISWFGTQPWSRPLWVFVGLILEGQEENNNKKGRQFRHDSNPNPKQWLMYYSPSCQVRRWWWWLERYPSFPTDLQFERRQLRWLHKRCMLSGIY